MEKLRDATKRLNVGSWGPFARRSSREEKRSSQVISASNDSDGSVSEGPSTAANGSSHKLSSEPPKVVISASKTTSLIELAKIIATETGKLETFLKENGHPIPSFEVDSPMNFPKLPDKIKKSREEVLRATKDLEALVTGPTESIRWMAWNHNDQVSLQAVYHYHIAKSFPLNETATYSQISEKVGLDEVNLKRFLRHAMTNHIFREPSPGIVAHTSLSRVLAEDKAMASWVGFVTEDMHPASSRTITALELHPEANLNTQTGFCVAHNTVDIEPLFATIGKDPERAKRMGEAMTSLTGGEGYELSYLLENYDWEALDKAGGTFVDVGGSHGFVCVALAEKYPSLKFVVEDLPKTVSSAPTLPSTLSSRISFLAHDFFNPQPIKGADVYFFRWVLHNQSDKYAIPMLRALTPALKKGARVLINDHVLREPGEEGAWDEKIMRTMDLVMLTMLNAKERTAEEFRELFAGADKRWRWVGVRRAKGYRMGIVEAVWEGEDFMEGGEGEGKVEDVMKGKEFKLESEEAKD